MIAARTTPAVTRQLNRWTYRPLRTEWTTIPAGEFLMGSLEGHRGKIQMHFANVSLGLKPGARIKKSATSRLPGKSLVWFFSIAGLQPPCLLTQPVVIDSGGFSQQRDMPHPAGDGQARLVAIHVEPFIQ